MPVLYNPDPEVHVMRGIVIRLLLVMVVVLCSGCPRPVGGCRYGSSGGESWTGEVTRIERQHPSGGAYIIFVERAEGAESDAGFFVNEADYETCLAPNDIEVGSEVSVEIRYGGPCPPMRRIMDCPWTS
jgi:hypothetical protein